jgi:acid phosphatase type 7
VTAATTFLTSDLAGRTNRCILAYWHHPRFSSGANHGNNAAMAPLWDRLYAAGADVVLVGHDHIYERFAPQTPDAVASPTGIREFVVGTGGRALHQLGTVRANSEVRIAGTFGVLRMTLNPASYDWRFQGEDGVDYDSGSDVCT